MGRDIHGFLVIDKPGGMTSRDAVNEVQRWFPRNCKIGHTGTLDPLATGVLVLCIGSATKLAEQVQAMEKTYRTQVLFGFTSDTDDADGQLKSMPARTPPTEAEVRQALDAFRGTILQTPPAYSALKKNGKRAHELARAGKSVQLEARPVTIHDIQLLSHQWPFADLEIQCSKGTYVRSIARDLGQALGCGGLVQKLRRTRVGPFVVEQGIGLDAEPSFARESVLPVSAIRADASNSHAKPSGFSTDPGQLLPNRQAHHSPPTH